MKKVILLCGFWGRGNCGDEAMLQCQYEFFVNNGFEVGIIIDKIGARDKFWDWYPYNKARYLISSHNLSQIMALNDGGELAGIHIGGGGLDFGFRSDFILNARGFGKPAFLTGVELNEEIESQFFKSYLDLFSFRADRYFDQKIREEFVSKKKPMGVLNMDLGSDWAFDLMTDDYNAIGFFEDRVLLVVREYDHSLVSQKYLDFLKLNIETIKLAGLKPYFLPFAPEDTLFLEHFELNKLAPVIELWNNPRRIQQYIASSKALLSYGRFHPVIFSANVGTNVALVAYAFNDEQEVDEFDKTQILTKMLDVDIIENQKQFLRWIHNPKPANFDKVTLAKNSLKQMQERILSHLL